MKDNRISLCFKYNTKSLVFLDQLFQLFSILGSIKYKQNTISMNY